MELYTAGTGNGQRAAIAVNECGVSCKIHVLNLGQGDQKAADYLKITGELDVDLRSNIAAEARAKIVYERLIDRCDDPGTKDALQFLMTREITHMKAFMVALESLGKAPLQIGELAPTKGLVDQYFNDSTGSGEDGSDMSSTFAPKSGFELVENPAFNPEEMAVNG